MATAPQHTAVPRIPPHSQHDRTEAPFATADIAEALELSETLQMYLRMVYELEEDGIPALRARLAERLGLSAPSVSQTVARLVEDGLLTFEADRSLRLTSRGRPLAAGVVRRHRLAVRFLTYELGLDRPTAEDEACAWEHVLSDQVERRLREWLDARGVPDPGEVAGLAGGAAAG